MELQAISTRGHHSQRYWTSAYTIEVKNEETAFVPLLTKSTSRPRVINDFSCTVFATCVYYHFQTCKCQVFRFCDCKVF